MISTSDLQVTITSMNLAVGPLEKWTWFVKKPQDAHRGKGPGRHKVNVDKYRPALVNQELGVENISTYLLYIVHSKWACMCCSPMKQGNAKWSGCCRNPNTRRQDCCGSSKRWTQQNSRNDCWTTCEKRYRCSWTMVLSFSCKFFGTCIYSWVTTKKKFAWLINWGHGICRKGEPQYARQWLLDWVGCGSFFNYIHTWQRVVSFLGMVSSVLVGFFLRVKSSDFQPQR